MALRITQDSMYRTQLAGLNDSLARLQKTQEQLTSGKKLNRPSDNPVDTVSAMRLRGEQRQLEQLGESLADGVSRLNTADGALRSASAMMQRLRTIAVAGSNGTLGPVERAAYADEVAQIRQSLVQMANTQYAGRPVFAGTANVAHAFDPATGQFQGNELPVLRAVSTAPGAAGQVNVAIPGSEIFIDADGVNYLAQLGDPTNPAAGPADGSLAAFEVALRSGDTAGIQSAISSADQQLERLGSALGTIGARTNRLESLQELNGRQDDASKIALSKVEDVDFIKAAMDLSIQSNAYNAALAASAKMIQPSLMDFLR